MSASASSRVVIEPFHQRRRAPEQTAALFAGGWPAFIHADALAAKHLPAVRELFADLEVALLVDGVLSAAAWGVPVRWNGTVADLPGGYSQALVRAVAEESTGTVMDTLVVCAAQVRPGAAGAGLAASLLGGLIEHATAGARRLQKVIAPLRPTGKHRYPLTPIETYAGWRHADGHAFDPWLTTHERMGARVLTTIPASQVFAGSVSDWQQWSGLALPTTGQYVVPDALAILHVDVETDRGRLSEPGIWVQHR